MGKSGHYVNQPTGYKAFIPSALPPHHAIQFDDDLTQLLSDANLALGRLDTMGYLLPNLDHILAMYVRKEALFSSQIEGTQASLEDLFEYESHVPLENINDVKEVVNYIKALNYGIEKVKTFPMSIRLIKEIHEILLKGARGSEKTPGEFRRSQNWIGSAGCTLKTASFIPPPPLEAKEAIGELELFLHKNKLPALVACALTHYQFETIHPFLDGNGRVGRLMITFYLCWKKVLQKPLLYLSYYFKIHRQEYYDRLNMVRAKGDYEQWIVFFLKGVIWTADSALETVKTILQLKEKHKNLLIRKKVSKPSAIALLDLLFVKPLISTQEVAELLKTSFPSANALIRQFVKYDILEEVTGKQRFKRFIYWEYLSELSEGTKPL